MHLSLQIKWLGIYIYLCCIVGGGIMIFFLLEISKKVKTACFTAFNLWAGPFSLYVQHLLTFFFVGADSVVTTWEQAWRSANLNHLCKGCSVWCSFGDTRVRLSCAK